MADFYNQGQSEQSGFVDKSTAQGMKRYDLFYEMIHDLIKKTSEFSYKEDVVTLYLVLREVVQTLSAYVLEGEENVIILNPDENEEDYKNTENGDETTKENSEEDEKIEFFKILSNNEFKDENLINETLERFEQLNITDMVEVLKRFFTYKEKREMKSLVESQNPFEKVSVEGKKILVNKHYFYYEALQLLRFEVNELYKQLSITPRIRIDKELSNVSYKQKVGWEMITKLK